MSLAAILTLFVFAIGALSADARSPVLRGNTVKKVPKDINERPIIGIVSLPAVGGFNDTGATSYFAASYVKWVESAGARVAPILYTEPRETIRNLLSSVNGVLITGGGAPLVHKNDSLTEFGSTLKFIYDEVVDINQKGEWFPLWGTCMGFQAILTVAANNGTILTRQGYDSENVSWPFNPTEQAYKSMMFRDMPEDAFHILTTKNVTLNAHEDGVTPEDFYANKIIAENFDILGIGYDKKHKPFVDAFERKDMPIFGVQFHPEKSAFEWRPDYQIRHTTEAVHANSWFARFFVSHARKNDRSFATAEEEFNALIYNHPVRDTRETTPSFVQVYAF